MIQYKRLPLSLTSNVTASTDDSKQNKSVDGSHGLHVQNRKIRVLLVITRLTIGGDTNVILDIASYLKHQPNYDVHLAVGPVPEPEVDLTCLAAERAIPLKMVHTMVNHINPWLNFRSILELYVQIRKQRYDIVHTHSSVAGVVGRLAAALAGVPIVVHHVHGWGVQQDMSKTLRTLYLGLERFCTRFTDRMIAVSRPTIEKGLAYGICAENKFSLIYNGIDLEKFQEQTDKRRVCLELGLDPECKIVGMIGRLDKQKNPLDFIRAASLVAKDYSKVQFVIAGDGSLRRECESLISDLNLADKFFLLGYRNDVNRILPILTLTVLSSLWEGLPVVFQESMSAGKPIIANDIDGARDVIRDGETGYLVAPRQPQEMADRILHLLVNDDLCNTMGVIAKRTSRRYSSERMVREIESLYSELLKDYYGEN